MKTRVEIVCLAVLALAPAAAAQRDTQRSMPLAGVSLELKAPKKTVIAQLSANATLKQGGDDAWMVYSSQKRGTGSWLGWVVFKNEKLVFAARSWGSPGHRMVKDFVAEVDSSRKSCQFAFGETPDQSSPVRLTSVHCGDRGLILQIGSDKVRGLYACEVETLGDSKGLLAKVDFWKPCHPAAPQVGSGH